MKTHGSILSFKLCPYVGVSWYFPCQPQNKNWKLNKKRTGHRHYPWGSINLSCLPSTGSKVCTQQCTRLEVQQCTRVQTTAYTRVHSHKIAEDSARGKASYSALYSADQSVGAIDYSKKNQENQISVELSISLLAWDKRESGGWLDPPFHIFSSICGIKSHYLLIPFI